MGSPTYIPLANVTLGGSDSDIIFSNIPQIYRDLVLVFNGSTTSGVALRIRPNSDSANASGVFMYGTGSGSGTSGTSSTADFFYTDSTSAYTGILQIMDYSATDKHKTMLVRSGSGASASGNFVWAFANRWASTTAITSLQLITSSSTLATGSTFSLYGIAG